MTHVVPAPVATLVLPLLRQRDEWLARCVESALGQTVSCEVIVVTERRTPASNLEVLRGWHGSRRLKVCLRPDGARFAGALNFGFARASCTRVGLLLTDDWLEPEAVEAALAHDADIVSTQAIWTLADGQAPVERLRRARTAAGYAACPDDDHRAQYLGHFLLLNRDAVLRAGGVDETVGDSPGVDDYHLLWTMLEQGATVSIVERPLYHVRDHEGERLTNRRPLDMWVTMRRILSKHGLRGAAREERLLWHTRWFGRPIAHSTDPVAERSRWVYAAEADEAVRPFVRQCAQQARSPASLEVHARRIAAGSRIPVSAALAALIEASLSGVLRPAASVRRSHGRTEHAGVIPTTIGVVTCDRPDLAAGAVAALGDHVRAHGHRARILVVDDSRVPEHRDAVARLAARAGDASVETAYIGVAEKAAICDELGQRFVGAPVGIPFAFADPYDTRYTLGANLNALMLATVGEPILSIDDDLRPVGFAPPEHDGPIALVSEAPAVERFFVSDDETAAWRHPFDLLAAHGRWLGRRGRGGPTGSHVVGTWTGVCGPIGFANATSRVLASEDPRLWGDSSRFEAVLSRPRALRCPNSLSLNRGVGLTSSTIALDQRVLLPPFFPFGRGIDLLWGIVAGLCRPDALFAHLPRALAHARATTQRPSTAEVSLWMILADAASRAAQRVGAMDPAQRMRAIGAGLVAHAARGAEQVEADVARLRAECHRSERESLEARRAARPEACMAWRAALDRRLQILANAGPRPVVPPEIERTAGGEDSGWSEVACTIRRYGELLHAWPGIVAHMQQRRKTA